MLYKIIYAAVLLTFVFVNIMAPAVVAAEGYTQIDLMILTHGTGGNRKYTVISRTELKDYSESGSLEIWPLSGMFDPRGETFHVCICCYASHIEYDTKNEGRPIPSEMEPTKTVLSYTADERDEKVRFDSEKAEYDLITEFGSNMQTLWQIEADGDVSFICSSFGHGFFGNMQQFYGD